MPPVFAAAAAVTDVPPASAADVLFVPAVAPDVPPACATAVAGSFIRLSVYSSSSHVYLLLPSPPLRLLVLTALHHTASAHHLSPPFCSYLFFFFSCNFFFTTFPKPVIVFSWFYDRSFLHRPPSCHPPRCSCHSVASFIVDLLY